MLAIWSGSTCCREPSWRYWSQKNARKLTTEKLFPNFSSWCPVKMTFCCGSNITVRRVVHNSVVRVITCAKNTSQLVFTAGRILVCVVCAVSVLLALWIHEGSRNTVKLNILHSFLAGYQTARRCVGGVTTGQSPATSSSVTLLDETQRWRKNFKRLW
jgi:hypothetical protein